MRSTNVRIAAAAALAAIALAACSSSSKSAGSAATSPPTEAPTTTSPSASTGGATGGSGTFTVALATVDVKGEQQKILVDSQGQVLYVDENDKPGKPACTGGCLTIWPPLKAAGDITVGPGLTASKYTTVTASDGTKQVAVNGSPLYLFAGKPAGDASGQDVGGFYVVQASGDRYDPGAEGS